MSSSFCMVLPVDRCGVLFARLVTCFYEVFSRCGTSGMVGCRIFGGWDYRKAWYMDMSYCCIFYEQMPCFYSYVHISYPVHHDIWHLSWKFGWEFTAHFCLLIFCWSSISLMMWLSLSTNLFVQCWLVTGYMLPMRLGVSVKLYVFLPWFRPGIIFGIILWKYLTCSSIILRRSALMKIEKSRAVWSKSAAVAVLGCVWFPSPTIGIIVIKIVACSIMLVSWALLRLVAT